MLTQRHRGVLIGKKKTNKKNTKVNHTKLLQNIAAMCVFMCVSVCVW